MGQAMGRGSLYAIIEEMILEGDDANE